MSNVQPPPPPSDARPRESGGWGPGDAAVVPTQTVLPPRATSPTTSWAVVGIVLAAGFFGNIALRTSLATAAAVVCVVLAIVALVVGGERRLEPLVVVGLALVLAPWLMIRSSAPLIAVTLLAIVVLLATGAGLSQRGSLLDNRARDLLGHIGSLAYEWLYGTAMVQRLVKQATTDQKATPVIRGVAVAVPVLIVFTTLLASADEVFARLLLLGNLPSAFGHLLLSLLIGAFLLGLVSRSVHEHRPSSDLLGIRFLGPVEILMILGSLTALFAAFVATQVIVAAGGADHVLVTEGLTQADHARRGFFQLLWVAGLTVVLVGGLRALRVTEPEHGRDRFRPLALTVLLFTLVIAAISMQRLGLYVGSFGLTPLRFWALAGTGLVGVVIALLALSIGGWRSSTGWFPGALLLVGVVFVFGLNAVNPDVFVASFNIENRSGSQLDVQALSELSDDAIPGVIASLDDLDNAPLRDLTQRLCRRFDRSTSYGILEYNRSAVRADAALDALCGQRLSREGLDGSLGD